MIRDAGVRLANKVGEVVSNIPQHDPSKYDAQIRNGYYGGQAQYYTKLSDSVEGLTPEETKEVLYDTKIMPSVPTARQMEQNIETAKELQKAHQEFRKNHYIYDQIFSSLPIIGTADDFVQAIRAAQDGNWLDFGMSLGSAALGLIPMVGPGGKIIFKLGTKGIKSAMKSGVKSTVNYGKNLYSLGAKEGAKKVGLDTLKFANNHIDDYIITPRKLKNDYLDIVNGYKDNKWKGVFTLDNISKPFDTYSQQSRNYSHASNYFKPESAVLENGEIINQDGQSAIVIGKHHENASNNIFSNGEIDGEMVNLYPTFTDTVMNNNNVIPLPRNRRPNKYIAQMDNTSYAFITPSTVNRNGLMDTISQDGTLIGAKYKNDSLSTYPMYRANPISVIQ